MPTILVVNAGSTSLKLHLVDEAGRAERVAELDTVAPGGVGAVAHRVVHGGDRFREPVVIDAQVRAGILELEPLAPLHNAPALRGIAAASQRFPEVPQVAVFDTAFHASMPREAATYAVPGRWREQWGVRRYGFHGLSVAWSARRAPELLERSSPELRLVVCHLGGGSSVTAVVDGRSVDTTMGFSPLEGVPMTTRSGSIDAGAVVYLLRERGLTAADLDQALNLESGLRALSGLEGDMRELQEAAARGHAGACLAFDVYTHRVAGAVAAMAASAGGLDALVFTAGIGERSAVVRDRICARLAFLGLELDAVRNASAEPDTDVAAAGSRVRVLVVCAREELVAAAEARRVLAGRSE
ncbi:MAG: acetate/propionate family kinase [Gaiellales bacterium]